MPVFISKVPVPYLSERACAIFSSCFLRSITKSLRFIFLTSKAPNCKVTSWICSCKVLICLSSPDEKFVTERAYDNPKFVEDMVRDIAVHFNNDDRVTEYVVESENFESIHNHSAYAQIHKVKEQK